MTSLTLAVLVILARIVISALLLVGMLDRKLGMPKPPPDPATREQIVRAHEIAELELWYARSGGRK